jgi:hypothetical protein
MPNSVSSRPAPVAAAVELTGFEQTQPATRRADGAVPAQVHPAGLSPNSARVEAGEAQVVVPNLCRRAVVPAVPPAQSTPSSLAGADNANNLLAPAHQPHQEASTAHDLPPHQNESSQEQQAQMDQAARVVQQGTESIRQVGENLTRTMRPPQLDRRDIDRALAMCLIGGPTAFLTSTLEQLGRRFAQNNPELTALGQRLAWKVVATASPVIFGAGAAIGAAGAVAAPVAYLLGAAGYLARHPSASDLLNFPHTYLRQGAVIGAVGYMGMAAAEEIGNTRGPIADALNLNPLDAAENAMNSVLGRVGRRLEPPQVAAIRQRAVRVAQIVLQEIQEGAFGFG